MTTAGKIITATSLKAQMNNALLDVKRFSGLLAKNDFDKADRECIADYLRVAVERVEALTAELVAAFEPDLSKIKRTKANAIAASIEPEFIPELWGDNALYRWLEDNDCLWFAVQKDWGNLRLAAQGAKHLQALHLIYSAEGDIDPRYTPPTMAAMKVQSMGYHWDGDMEVWSIEPTANEKQKMQDIMNDPAMPAKYRAALTIIKSLNNDQIPTEYFSATDAYDYLSKRGIRWFEDAKAWVQNTYTNR